MVVPTITEQRVESYRDKLKVLQDFASEIHIDLSDGIFAPGLVDYADAFRDLPKSYSLHLMFEDPSQPVDLLVELGLRPRVVILQAEAKSCLRCLTKLKEAGIAVGVCLLQGSAPEDYAELIKLSGEVMIFSGSLGKQGGAADFSLLNKVGKIRSINPNVSVSWDGGINANNLPELKGGGVTIFYVGGAIAKAEDPASSYEELVRLDALEA